MSESPSPAPWSTVAALPDYLLLAQTRQLARHEQALQILVLDHLREIEARRLHLTRGYGSLFDYVVHELGYTAAAAWRRIKAMRLCTETGAARELLRDGSLNLSNAAQLQNLFERSDRSRGRPPGGDGAGDGLGGEPRGDGASGEPGPAAATRAGERDPAPAAGPVLDAAAREELVRQAAGKSTREVQQMLAEVDPELAQPSDRMRALGGGRWELKATIDAECRHGLEKLLMLLSHRDPHLTLGGLAARLVRDGLDRYDPARPPRSRRTGGRGSVDGAGSANTPARRDADSVARNEVRANGSVERDGPSRAADRDGLPGASAPKRDTQAERDNTKSAPMPDGGRRTDSAPTRHAEAEHGGTTSAAARDIVRRIDQTAKVPSEATHGSGALVAAAGSGAYATSAASQSGAEPADSAAKRVGQDKGVHVEGARPGAGTARAPGRRRETERAGGQPKATGGGGRIASPAKRQGRADGDGRDAGVDGFLDRATCAAGPRFEADRRDAARATGRGGRRCPTSAPKPLAYAAGHGAMGTGQRSPALERHLAALRCVGAVPGSRSRYIPAVVRREVWRRDQGCCSYVDPHSGRRCGSRYRLEIDHIVPFALGGGAEPGDLRLLCEAHHRLRHAHAESVPT